MASFNPKGKGHFVKPNPIQLSYDSLALCALVLGESSRGSGLRLSGDSEVPVIEVVPERCNSFALIADHLPNA